MLKHMRTTVILPDELYRQVKERARTDGRTVTSFLEQALRQALSDQRQEPRQKADVILAPAYFGKGGTMPGVDLNNNAALEDLMDEDDFTMKNLRAQQAARR